MSKPPKGRRPISGVLHEQRPPPYQPAVLTADQVSALKALTGLQIEALRALTGADQPTFWPDSERVSAFAQGKRHVWDQLVAAHRVKLATTSSS